MLLNIAKKFNPAIPNLIIPVLVDINKFESNVYREDRGEYFLYVGAAGYSEINKTILESFDLLADSNTKLYLVLNGSIR